MIERKQIDPIELIFPKGGRTIVATEEDLRARLNDGYEIYKKEYHDSHPLFSNQEVSEVIQNSEGAE